MDQVKVNPLARNIDQETGIALRRGTGSAIDENGVREVPADLVARESIVNGNVLILPPSKTFRNGTLIKNTEVSPIPSRNTYKVVSERAPLDEVILETPGTIKLRSQPVSFEGSFAPGVTVENAQASIYEDHAETEKSLTSKSRGEIREKDESNDLSIKVPMDDWKEETGISGSITLKVSNKPSMLANDEVQGTAIEDIFSVTGGLDLKHASLSNKTPLKDGKKKVIPLIEEGKWNYLVPLPSVSLPLVITGGLHIVVSLKAEGEITFEPSFKVESVTNAELANGKIKTFQETTGALESEDTVALSGEGTVRVALGVSLEATVLDMIGLEFRAETGPQIKVEIQNSKEEMIERKCILSHSTELELLGVAQPPFISRISFLPEKWREAEINSPSLKKTIIHDERDLCPVKKQELEVDDDAIELTPHPTKFTNSEGVASIELPWKGLGGISMAGCDFYRDRPESSGCGNVEVRQPLSPIARNTGWAFANFPHPEGEWLTCAPMRLGSI